MGHLNPPNVSNSSQNPLGGASHRCPKKCQYQTSMRYLIGVHLTELRTPLLLLLLLLLLVVVVVVVLLLLLLLVVVVVVIL